MSHDLHTAVALTVAAGTWALAACCPSAPKTTAETPPAPPPVAVVPLPAPAPAEPAPPRAKPLLATPTSQAELDVLIQSAGCLFASPSGRVACLRAPADMGYTTMELFIVEGEAERDRFSLYGHASMVYDEKAVHPEAFAAANAFLEAGQFRRGGKPLDVAAASVQSEKLVVKHDGQEASTVLPPLPQGDATTDALDAHVAACCEWKPRAGWVFDEPGVAAVPIYRSCKWSRTAEQGIPKVCVDPEHNAENYVDFERVLVVELGE